MNLVEMQQMEGKFHMDRPLEFEPSPATTDTLITSSCPSVKSKSLDLFCR